MAREEEDELEASAVSTSREADSQDGAQQGSFRFSLDEGRFASSGVSQKRPFSEHTSHLSALLQVGLSMQYSLGEMC